jgi:histidine triad (HIT) family protein
VADQPLDCPFCAIAAGLEPDRVVIRWADVFALMDVAPINRGHLLVVPIEHVPSLAALDAAVGARMFMLAQVCAAALRACGLRCEGVNLFLNDGRAAFQVVDHVHLHVLPRYIGDAFEPASSERRTADSAELASVASRLRSTLGRAGAPGGQPTRRGRGSIGGRTLK